MKFIKKYTAFYGSSEWTEMITSSIDSKEFMMDQRRLKKE